MPTVLGDGAQRHRAAGLPATPTAPRGRGEAGGCEDGARARAAPPRVPPPGRRGPGPAVSGPRPHARSAHAQAATAAAEPMASERLPSRPACLLVASGAAEGEARAAGVPWAPGGRAGGGANARLRPAAPGAGGPPTRSSSATLSALCGVQRGGDPGLQGWGAGARLPVRGDGSPGWRPAGAAVDGPPGGVQKAGLPAPWPRAAAVSDRRGQGVERGSGCSEEVGGLWQAWGSDSPGLGSIGLSEQEPVLFSTHRSAGRTRPRVRGRRRRCSSGSADASRGPAAG